MNRWGRNSSRRARRHCWRRHYPHRAADDVRVSDNLFLDNPSCGKIDRQRRADDGRKAQGKDDLALLALPERSHGCHTVTV